MKRKEKKKETQCRQKRKLEQKWSEDGYLGKQTRGDEESIERCFLTRRNLRKGRFQSTLDSVFVKFSGSGIHVQAWWCFLTAAFNREIYSAKVFLSLLAVKKDKKIFER